MLRMFAVVPPPPSGLGPYAFSGVRLREAASGLRGGRIPKPVYVQVPLLDLLVVLFVYLVFSLPILVASGCL